MRTSLISTLIAGLVCGLGCSGNEGDLATDDDASLEGSIEGGGNDEAAVGDADGGDATKPGDAITDTSGGSDTALSRDVALDASRDAPPDSTDAATLCEGFSTKPLEPPLVCDKASGNTTSEKPANRLYSTSNFGCYRKADGTIYKDPSDNCFFACGDMGLCPGTTGTTDGPTCEATLRWFTADADRFGCGKRIRLTNCLNGKHAIAVALDKGPNCKNEQTYATPVIDMSHDLMVYLFDGKLYGGVDKKRIVVEEVPATTKLGPE